MLRARARHEQTTISELVRTAVRERYVGNYGRRMKAMQEAFVGIRKQDSETPGAAEIVRSLRQGNRLARLAAR